MDQLDSELAYTPEAAIYAARFGVPPEIHRGDFIYQHLLGTHRPLPDHENREHVLDYYFADGDRSARRLDELVRRFHPHAGARRLSLLEFASGYGCVSRHLGKMADRYDSLACDIHPQAIDFLEHRLAIPALLSRSDPAEFKPDSRFDVVFALSFFSHIPHRNWGRWISALFDCVEDGGLLIFTAHGRVSHADVKLPVLQPAGYWFEPLSEQNDLPSEEYGAMVVTPSYAIERIEACPLAALLFFEEAFWWGKQDLFVVRRVSHEFRRSQSAPDAVIVQLEADNERLGNEKFRLAADNYRVALDNYRLTVDNNNLVAENQRLTGDRDRVAADSHRLTVDNNNLVAENQRLDSDSQRVQAENFWLNAENNRLMVDERWHREALTVIYASTSWRLTAPLRVFGRLLGRRKS